MGFMVFYVLFIISIICFLIKLLFKYFDIKLFEQIKEKIYKIPKVKETFEKLYVFFRGIGISEALKSIASSVKASLRKVKPAKEKMVKGNPVVYNEARVPLQANLSMSMAGGGFSNNTNFSDAFKKERILFDRNEGISTEVPEKVEEKEYREYIQNNDMEQNISVREPVSTNPISIIGNIANVPLDVNNGPSDTRVNASSNIMSELNNKNVSEYSDSRLSEIIQRTVPVQARPAALEKEPLKKGTFLNRFAREKALKIDEESPKEKVYKQEFPKEKDIKKRISKERTLEEDRDEQAINSKNKVKPKKKRYEIVQTGYVSVFFSRTDNVIIVPYGRDISGKGRALDAIMYLKYPISQDELGRAVKNSANLGNDVYAYSDKELLKKMDVKEWSDFTFDKRHISIKLDSGCGYILNATTRNSDGSYRVNCPGGIEKIVRKDADSEELGDVVLKLLEKCKF